jgi:hypothetical protein
MGKQFCAIYKIKITVHLSCYFNLFLLVSLLFNPFYLKAQIQSVTLTSNGSWTVPEGVTHITIEAWGGGGGGSNISDINKDNSGGGGGAYAKSILSISPGTYSVTVGAGGAPGAPGGVSSFGNFIIASGGNSGTANIGGAGGQASTSIGQFKFSGGNGADAPGGGGSSAGRTINGNNASGITGGAAPEGGGNGGSIPPGTNNRNGENGTAPGGGGAGRVGPGNNIVAGSGAPGQVIISWCFPPQLINHPADQIIMYGNHAVFNVFSDDVDVTYQWELSVDDGNSWNFIEGETGTALFIYTPSVSQSGFKYRCQVSSDCGISYSNAAILTVNKADAIIDVSPYQVTYNGMEHISTGTATGVSGETLSELDLSGTIHTDAGIYSDTWTFTDETGNYNHQSGTVENIIYPENLIIQAHNHLKCYGEEFIFSGNEFTVSGLVTDEMVGEVVLVSPGAASDANPGTYPIMPSEASGDSFKSSNYSIVYTPGDMTVKPLPALSGAEQQAPVCEGTFATINLSGLLPENMYSLDYNINGVPQPSITGLYSDASGNSSFNTTSLLAENNNHILRITSITITSEIPYCTKTFSIDVILEVNQLPNLSEATIDAVVCEGFAATINLTGLHVGHSFLVYYTINDIQQEPAGTLEADESGNASFQTQVLSLENDGQKLHIYRIENFNTGCFRDFSFQVILGVNPEGKGGTATASMEMIYWGGTTVLNLSEYQGDIQWQQSADGNTNWVNVVGGTGGISDNYTIIALKHTTWYRAQVVNANCQPVYSNEVSVVVLANNFEVSAVMPAAICNAADGVADFKEDYVTTEISFFVKMLSGYKDFSPEWEFTFTLSSSSGATIDGVTPDSGILFFSDGVYSLTGLTSTSGEGSVVIIMNVTGDPYDAEDAVLKILSAKELVFFAGDVDLNNGEAVQVINPIPQTSDITTN